MEAEINQLERLRIKVKPINHPELGWISMEEFRREISRKGLYNSPTNTRGMGLVSTKYLYSIYLLYPNFTYLFSFIDDRKKYSKIIPE